MLFRLGGLQYARQDKICFGGVAYCSAFGSSGDTTVDIVSCSLRPLTQTLQAEREYLNARTVVKVTFFGFDEMVIEKLEA